MLAVAEFRALTLAWVVSLAGDQLARVALSVLTFTRTGSALLTAAVYAVTFLPAVIGGPLLAGLADRLPRRRVMVGVDLARAVVVLGMAVPGAPLALLLLLLVVVVALEAPFSAARGPLLRVVLADGDYRAAVGLDVSLRQLASVAAFAGGGVLLTLVTPAQALLLDSLTFVISAAVLTRGVRPRPAVSAVHAEAAGRRGGLLALAGRDAREGLRTILRHPLRRRAVLLTWLVLLGTIGSEGVAVPWARQLGGGSAAAGVLLAAPVAGEVLVLLVLTRPSAPAPERLLAPLAVLAPLPFLACALNPGLITVVVLVTLGGAGISVVSLAQVVFVEATPDEVRGRALGVAAAGVTAVQGVAVALTGALAELTSPPTAVAALAGLGLLGVAVVVIVPNDTGAGRRGGAAATGAGQLGRTGATPR